MDQIYPKPVGENLYEFVFLKDFPNKVVSNSDDPPSSFHSKDVFTPHPTIQNAWKYVTRMDDRVTLLNGEKVLPLPIEGKIRQHNLVREVIVFGIGRAIPGVLLFRADSAKGLSNNDFIDRVWPTIEEANKNAESFSQISKEMVEPLPAGIDIPHTDKGSVIRAQAYKIFEREIEESYTHIEDADEGIAVLDLPGTIDYLLGLGREILGPHMSSADEDLFSLGLNSLQAIRMRGMILKHLDLGGHGKKLNQNVVFEQGNIANLARHLHTLRFGTVTGNEKPIALIKEMTTQFSIAPSSHERSEPVVVSLYSSSSTLMPVSPQLTYTQLLTGATGGLGAHLLSQLSQQAQIEHIYCLLRGADAPVRLLKSLKAHHLPVPSPERYTVLTSSLHEADLGLSLEKYQMLKMRVTHVIHAAWPVNFQLGLPSFTSSLQGLHNLLELSVNATSGPRPARLIFCSSISVALDTPLPATIPEEPIADLNQVSETGYAASKLVGEKIVEAAVQDAAADASVVRIGQIVGDTHAGIWNDMEMVPLIVRSALTMGVLPETGEQCCWLPVDTCAKAIIEIEGLDESARKARQEANGPTTATVNKSRDKRLIYNISSPLTFRWNEDLLPALKSSGLHFEAVPFSQWIRQLHELAAQPSVVDNRSRTTANDADRNVEHSTTAAADPEQNPALKLIDFFEKSYSRGPSRQDGAGGVTFAIEKAEKASPSLKNTENVIESGLVGKMLDAWMRKWKGDGWTTMQTA